MIFRYLHSVEEVGQALSPANRAFQQVGRRNRLPHPGRRVFITFGRPPGGRARNASPGAATVTERRVPA